MKKKINNYNLIIITTLIVMILAVFVLSGCETETEDTDDTSSDLLPAPKNLRAEAGTNSSGNPTVALTWTPVSGASYYEIYRTTDKTWSDYLLLYQDIKVTDVTESYKLISGETYYYKVGAKKHYINDPVGILSEAVGIKVFTLLSGITGIAANALSDSSIKVTWNVLDGASKYRIYRGRRTNNPGDMKPAAYVNAPATEYTDTSLMPDTYYYYRIAAIDSEDREGPLSSDYDYAITKVPITPPPDNLTAAAHGRVITLKWDAVEDANYYYIFGAFAEDGPYVLIYSLSASYGTTAYNVSALTPGSGVGLSASTTYYFKVSTGGDMSAPVSATTGS